MRIATKQEKSPAVTSLATNTAREDNVGNNGLTARPKAFGVLSSPPLPTDSIIVRGERGERRATSFFPRVFHNPPATQTKVPRFTVTLDNRYFEGKPTGRDAAGITNRLKRAKPSLVTAEQFCEHVRRGGTFMCGVHEPSGGSGWGRFVSQQVYALDFDNATEGARGGKRQLEPGESGYLDFVDALDRCYSSNLEPLCLYFSFNADANAGKMRYRLVFAMDEPTGDLGHCRKYLGELLRLFPEADQACSNPSTRLFYGSNREVLEAWRLEGVA